MQIDGVRLAFRPLECPSCDKRFVRASNLQRHIKGVHLGVKPYMCDYCDLKFIQKSDKIKHVKRKHERRILNLEHLSSEDSAM